MWNWSYDQILGYYRFRWYHHEVSLSSACFFYLLFSYNRYLNRKFRLPTNIWTCCLLQPDFISIVSHFIELNTFSMTISISNKKKSETLRICWLVNVSFAAINVCAHFKWVWQPCHFRSAIFSVPCFKPFTKHTSNCSIYSYLKWMLKQLIEATAHGRMPVYRNWKIDGLSNIFM